MSNGIVFSALEYPDAVRSIWSQSSLVAVGSLVFLVRKMIGLCLNSGRSIAQMVERCCQAPLRD